MRKKKLEKHKKKTNSFDVRTWSKDKYNNSYLVRELYLAEIRILNLKIENEILKTRLSSYEPPMEF